MEISMLKNSSRQRHRVRVLRMLVLWLFALLCARAAVAQPPDVSELEAPQEFAALSDYTKLVLAGQVGVLAQAVRIPKSLFAKSSCQMVFLASPDWTTSEVYVDFGTSGMESSGNRCTKRGFMTYADGYYVPSGLTGITRRSAVPWASVLTDPLSDGMGLNAAPPPAEAPPQAGPGLPPPSAPDASARRRRLGGLSLPMDREKFNTAYDNLRDSISGLATMLQTRGGTDEVIPGPRSPLSRPVMASSILQRVAAIPEDPQPFLEYLERQAKVVKGDQAGGETKAEEAAVISGRARIFAPWPRECADLVRRHKGWQATQTDVALSSPPPTSQDSCFVTQQVVFIYNDCGNVTGDAAINSTSRRVAPLCSGEGSDTERLACLMDQQLSKEAANLSYAPAYGDVNVVVRYKPYLGCYRNRAQRLGQASVQILLFTALLLILLVLVVLTPTLFRALIVFPCRCMAHAFRVVFRGKVKSMPMGSGLHPLQNTGYCGRNIWGVSALLRARKHLVYAICTVHSADGQFRSLQVAVISNVALMICMVSFPPNIVPPLEYFVPPLSFKIVRESGDALASVWFFLELLIYSLYMGFIGYLALLCNYNRPRNGYYLTQCILSVLFMLVLDALLLAHIASILWYWDHLDPRFPWIPITAFQLLNLGAANVLLLVVCCSRHDRRDARRLAEYVELREELAEREAHAAERANARAAAKAGAVGVGVPVPLSMMATIPTDGGPRVAPPSAPLTPPPPPPPLQAADDARQDRKDVVPEAPEAPELGSPSGGSPPPASTGTRRTASLHANGHTGSDASASGGAKPFDDLRGIRAEGEDGAVSVPRGASARTTRMKDFVLPEPEVAPTGASAPASASAPAPPLQQPWGRRIAGSRQPAWLRKITRHVSEDAAFRYPAWLLAALLVSGYMLIFTYARAVMWSYNVGNCIADPTECLNNVVGRYIMFASRMVSREQQEEVRGTLKAVLDTRVQVQASLQTILADQTAPIVTDALGLPVAAGGDPLGRAVADGLAANLDFDVGGAMNRTLGPELAAMVPENQAAEFRDLISATIRERILAMNLTAQSTPLVNEIGIKAVRIINNTLEPVYGAINNTQLLMTKALDFQGSLSNWRERLEQRFFACSVAGFTLGLLLGLSSLIGTAVSFRTSARKLRLWRQSLRIFGGGAAPGFGNDDGYGGAATAGGNGWHAANVKTVYSADGGIVSKIEGTTISLVVFFFGVLLSTAIVQLYAVGVVLSIVLSIVSHPWTWTWLLPNYYLWLVAIIAVVIINKVILITMIGNTWLSDGDHIHRPAAWLAFLVIASATNLVIGLLLAAYRIIFLLATTIFALGKLDVTIFTFFASLDLPHRAFLAGLHLQESMSQFHDPVYLPGPRGRAHQRWRRLRSVIRTRGAEELRQLVYPGEEVAEGKAVLVIIPDEVFVEEGGTSSDGARTPPAQSRSGLPPKNKTP